MGVMVPNEDAKFLLLFGDFRKMGLAISHGLLHPEQFLPLLYSLRDDRSNDKFSLTSVLLVSAISMNLNLSTSKIQYLFDYIKGLYKKTENPNEDSVIWLKTQARLAETNVCSLRQCARQAIRMTLHQNDWLSPRGVNTLEIPDALKRYLRLCDLDLTKLLSTIQSFDWFLRLIPSEKCLKRWLNARWYIFSDSAMFKDALPSNPLQSLMLLWKFPRIDFVNWK